MDPDGGSAQAGQPAQSRGHQQGARGPHGAGPDSRTRADAWLCSPLPQGGGSRWEEGVQGPSDNLVQVLLSQRQESYRGHWEGEAGKGRKVPPGSAPSSSSPCFPKPRVPAASAGPASLGELLAQCRAEAESAVFYLPHGLTCSDYPTTRTGSKTS